MIVSASKTQCDKKRRQDRSQKHYVQNELHFLRSLSPLFSLSLYCLNHETWYVSSPCCYSKLLKSAHCSANPINMRHFVNKQIKFEYLINFGISMRAEIKGQNVSCVLVILCAVRLTAQYVANNTSKTVILILISKRFVIKRI